MKIKNTKNKFNGGEISFGMEVLLFLLVVFIIWVLAGGPAKSKQEKPKPFITPLTDEVNPGKTYGPGEN